MKNKELNIFLVSLGREINKVKKNIHNFEKIYNSYNLNFFIICPAKDKKIFELFKNKNISIINSVWQQENLLDLKKLENFINTKIFIHLNTFARLSVHSMQEVKMKMDLKEDWSRLL